MKLRCSFQTCDEIWLCGHLSLTPISSGLFRFSNHQAFLDILNEMNDYAGQRELIAENMMMNICIELTKYLQDLKLERKSVSVQGSKCVSQILRAKEQASEGAR